MIMAGTSIEPWERGGSKKIIDLKISKNYD